MLSASYLSALVFQFTGYFYSLKGMFHLLIKFVGAPELFLAALPNIAWS